MLEYTPLEADPLPREQTPHPPGADTPGADTPQSRHPPGSGLQHIVNERPVRILLECILVNQYIKEFLSSKFLDE